MKKRYTLIIISLVSVAVILIAAAIILFTASSKPFEKPGSETTPDEATPDTVTITEAVSDDADSGDVITDPSTGETILETTDGTTGESTAPLTAPDEMNAVLERGGYTLQTISDIGCTQLVTVSSSGSSADIRFFSLENNEWVCDDSLSCTGFVGRNGVTADMHEGGNASPFGLYHIGDAFYFYDQPSTGLNTFQVTNDTYWVDDPDSSHYNQHMEGTAEKDWNSAEHMIDYNVYRYGFVIDYNTAAVYNAGSAIFFHISANPTAGCIGTDEASVLAYLAKLDASANPFILIV